LEKLLFSELLINFNYFTLLFIVFTFFISGVVKGFLGIGLPSAAMALLTLVIDPIEAIPIMVIPIIFTNFVQYLRAPEPLQTAKDLKYFGFFIVVSIFFTSLYIKSYPSELLTIAIGFAMIVFSLNNFFGLKIKIGPSYIWHVCVGTFSGILGGLSSIWSPPIAMYLIARNYSKEKFLSASGFLFLVGSFPLGAGLYFSGVLTVKPLFQSLLALAFVLMGFRVGEIIRDYVNQKIFRNCILIAFLIMGSRLIFEGFA